MEFFTGLLHSQFLVTPRLPTKSFTSQTVIVTGSNTGLGFEAAKHVAKLGASLLILAVRTVSKGESAKAAILAATKQPSSSIEVWELDMNSYDSVKAFAKRASKLERLDVVLENAGIMSNHFKVVEGYEVVITTNVISTFLLALLLLPKLKESSEKFNIKPRLTIVASDMHILAKFKERNAEDIFAALNDENSFDASDRYTSSPSSQKSISFAYHISENILTSMAFQIPYLKTHRNSLRSRSLISPNHRTQICLSWYHCQLPNSWLLPFKFQQ